MRPHPGFRSFFRVYERELTCARCRGVVARIRLGPWRLMRITHVDGYEVTPQGTEVTVRVLQTRIATALDTAPELALGPDTKDQIQLLQDRIDYVRSEAGEVFYELVCVCGTRYLRSLPHLVGEVRAASAGRVVLRG